MPRDHLTYSRPQTENPQAAAARGKVSDGVADHVLRDRLSANSEVAFNYLVEMIPLVKKKRDISVHIQDEYRISPYLTARSKSSQDRFGA